MNSEEKKLNEEASPRSGSEETVPHQRELTSEAIFAGKKSITITHDGIQYRLLITRNNKLILQK